MGGRKRTFVFTAVAQSERGNYKWYRKKKKREDDAAKEIVWIGIDESRRAGEPASYQSPEFVNRLPCYVYSGKLVRRIRAQKVARPESARAGCALDWRKEKRRKGLKISTFIKRLIQKTLTSFGLVSPESKRIPFDPKTQRNSFRLPPIYIITKNNIYINAKKNK